MKRLAVSLCTLIVLSFQQTVCAQDRTLLAEGDSVALTKSGAKPLSHWKLWRLDSGYEVVDSNARIASAIQIFRFDSKFMPIGFSKESGPLEIPNPNPRINIPKFPKYRISCEYKATEMICESLAGDGTPSTVAIAAERPYVVVGEFYDLDFLWFMTGVVHLAPKGKTGGLVNVYALTDGKAPKVIGLKADKPIRVVPDGDGSATVLGREQPVTRYKYDGKLLTGTDQGLIVRMMMSSNPEFGYAIDNYKEYEPWGAPF